MSFNAFLRFVEATEALARDCNSAGFSFSRLKGGALFFVFELDFLCVLEELVRSADGPMVIGNCFGEVGALGDVGVRPLPEAWWSGDVALSRSGLVSRRTWG